LTADLLTGFKNNLADPFAAAQAKENQAESITGEVFVLECWRMCRRSNREKPGPHETT